MANGWGPRNGEEMFADIYQKLRTAGRNPRFDQYLGEVPGAIDASGGHDVSPATDFFIDGLDDDYPLPQPPPPDTPPPTGEDAAPVDGLLEGGSSTGNMDAVSSSITSPSGYPTYSNWSIFGNDFGATTSGDIINVPVGTYIAQVKLNGTISPVQTDLILGLNLFSPSAYVTQEFHIPMLSTSQPGNGYSAGPWPVVDLTEGQLSVSVYFAISGTPTVTGTCTLLLTKLS